VPHVARPFVWQRDDVTRKMSTSAVQAAWAHTFGMCESVWLCQRTGLHHFNVDWALVEAWNVVQAFPGADFVRRFLFARRRREIPKFLSRSSDAV
jgi:hypothetical protein